MNLNLDVTLIIYILVSLSGWYGFFMFFLHMKALATLNPKIRVGVIYRYVTFLYLGIAIHFSINTVARFYRVCESDSYSNFLDTPFWAIRSFFILLPILGIIIHMKHRQMMGE